MDETGIYQIGLLGNVDSLARLPVALFCVHIQNTGDERPVV